MALLEREAQRLARALDDYDHVSVADMGGTDASGYWLVVHDHRFDLRYEITYHCDYWEFIFRHAVGRPSAAATWAARATA